MIKVGIIGCGDLHAAELVRLLINHPDVELIWITDADQAGRRLDSVISGIVGECDLTVTAEGSLDDVDLVYLCGSRAQVSARLKASSLPETLRVIDLSGSHNTDCDNGEQGWTYGMSEMQRRVLVHESRWVTIPGNAAMAALLALLPMARNLMLNSPVALRVAMGDLAFPAGGVNLDGMDPVRWSIDQCHEVAVTLTRCQSSFDQPVDLTITRLSERRTLAAAARFRCGVDGETVRQLYEQYYEDHNFVYIVDRPVVTADVENTNKCLICLDKDERTGLLTVNAVMDLLLKGAAGTAVHAMNLMYGLHERVGLSLKGTGC